MIYIKNSIVAVVVVTFFGLISASSAVKAYPGTALVNRIDGIVWDPNHRPVSDVYVELQNEMYMSLNRLRTTTSGRFSFTVTNPGNYYVKVLAGNTNYLDAIEPVEIVNVTVRSSDSQYMDIVLKIDKRKIGASSAMITDAVFAQEVPEAARGLFRDAAKDLQEKKDTGFSKLDEALKLFPDYFDALNLAGREYVQRKEYEKSLPYLIHAIDLNQRSYTSYYSLALACYQLNHRPEALKAAKAAVVLVPNSVNALVLYGMLLRLDSDFKHSEESLLKAKQIAKDNPQPEIHMQLALLYNRTGRNKQAIDELNAYLKVAPEAPNKAEVKELIRKLQKENETSKN